MGAPLRGVLWTNYTKGLTMKLYDALPWATETEMDVPFIKIVGGGGTGKTAGLAARVAHLLACGAGAGEILVLCATRSAADAFAGHLAKAGVAADIRVATPQEYFVEMLAGEEAHDITGRNPRILADFEERILMEDMKVCGLKPKRLREMLKFFYRELSELGDEKDGFIQDTEEQDIYDTLQENLRLRGGMLMQELSNVACKFVRDHAEAAAPWKRAFVLCDDFQNLNLASQKCVELLATRQLVVAGALNEQLPTVEPYPYPQGFRTFELTHDGVQVVALSKGLRSPERITRMANAMADEGGLDRRELVEPAAGAPSEVRFVKWTHPNDEFLGLVRYIKHRLADESHPIHAKDIFVAVPNAVWGRAIAKVLRANRIDVDEVLSRNALGGDPRKDEKSLDMQAYTRLNLAADPTDAVAWRSFCGFGDFLTNSNHWFRLEKYAQEAGIGVLEALDRAEMVAADGELFAGAGVLLARYRAGKRFIEEAAGKLGFTLANLCAPESCTDLPAGFANLINPVTGGETASDLLKRANARMEARFTDIDAVRVGPMEMTCGMEFDTVIFAGCIEGFWPALVTLGVEYDDDRIAEVRRDERRTWYAAMTKARYSFVASTVQKDEANTAQALGMHVRRIRMEDGKSMATLAPTRYLDEMGAEAPGFDAEL